MDDGMNYHGHIAWSEPMSDDVDRARDFYTGVLGIIRYAYPEQ